MTIKDACFIHVVLLLIVIYICLNVYLFQSIFTLPLNLVSLYLSFGTSHRFLIVHYD